MNVNLATQTAKAAVLSMAVLIASPLSCKDTSQTPQDPTPVDARTYEEFAATINSYPYDASAQGKLTVLKGYPKLEIGMTKAQIRSLIGEPDFGQQNYGPKGPNMRWLGSSWTYDLKMRDTNVNLLDPSVEIFFGTDDRADWI